MHLKLSKVKNKVMAGRSEKRGWEREILKSKVHGVWQKIWGWV